MVFSNTINSRNCVGSSKENTESQDDDPPIDQANSLNRKGGSKGVLVLRTHGCALLKEESQI